MTKSPDDARRSAADQALVDVLAQLSFTVQAVLAEEAAQHDLSLTQLRLLGVLEDHTLAMAELADHLRLDRSSVTGLVDRAEKRGLVTRAPRPEDGRGIQVDLAPSGRSLLEKVRGPVTHRLLALAGTLPVRDRASLSRLAHKMLTPP